VSPTTEKPAVRKPVLLAVTVGEVKIAGAVNILRGVDLRVMPGETVSIEVYYHNNGPAETDIATNVYTWMSIPSTLTSSQTISGGVRASNASPATGQVSLSIVGGNGTERLEFIPGSVRWYPNQAAQSPGSLLSGQNGTELFGSQGLYVGDQHPGWYDQANVVADFRITQTAAPVCPTITTNNATNVTQNGATLNGNISGTGTGITSWFEYGTTNSFGQSTSQNTAQAGATSAVLGNLTPNTTYFFRAIVQSSGCTQAIGQTLSFMTTGSQVSCPTIASNLATNTTLNSATLNATIAGVTGIGPGFHFDYGTTQSFGQSTVVEAAVNGAVNSFVGNLTPNTTYYFRAVIQAAGCADAYGQTLSFVTTGSQQNITGKDIFIQYQRGDTFTAPLDGWGYRFLPGSTACVASLPGNVVYRKWLVTVAIDGIPYNSEFALPDNGARYLAPYELTSFGTEFFSQPGFFQIYLWEPEFRRENSATWEPLNHWKVVSYVGSPQNPTGFGFRLTNYQGQLAIEVSNDGSNTYFTNPGTIFSIEPPPMINKISTPLPSLIPHNR